jgi:hypothetical protein
VIPRSLIIPAPYNPQVMTDYGRKLLRDKIKDVGCLEALVWNETTGHMIGGHNRLAVLDELEGTLTYEVGVAVVHLPLKREMEMNVFLNNQLAQGNFDKDRFVSLLLDEKYPLELTELGFTRIDLELEFGSLPELNLGPSIAESQAAAIADVVAEAEVLAAPRKKEIAILGPAEAPPPAAKKDLTPEEAESQKRAIQKIKEAKRRYAARSEASPEHDVSYFLVITFANTAQRDLFLDSRKLDRNTKYLLAETADV